SGLLARSADRPAAMTVRSGVYRDGFDKAVRPQDDFFRHFNGGWIGRQGRFLLPWGLRPVPPTSRGGTCPPAVRRRQAQPTEHVGGGNMCVVSDFVFGFEDS